MNNTTDWTRPRRQSKVILLLSLWNVLKSLWPILLIFTAKVIFNERGASPGKFTTIMWIFSGAIVFILASKINELTRFFFFRFCIIDQQLVIYSGLFVKKKTALPLSKIQAIHTRQNLLHQLTNTCKLVIDTGGTEKEEMEIGALDVRLAKDFQAALKPATIVHPTGDIEISPPTGPAPELLRLSFTDTLKLCISENHFKTFLVLLAFLLGKMQDIREYLGFDSYGWMQQHASGLMATTQNLLAIFIIGMVIAILFSAVRVVFRFFGFTIQLQQADIVMKWGLLETQQKHIPFKKVQLISWRSTYLRRIMGMTMLRLHATAEDESKADQLIQAPLTRREHIKSITKHYQPELPASHVPFICISKKYIIRKILLVGIPVTLAISTGLYFFIGWYALFATLWLFYFSVTQLYYQRNFKTWISQEAMQLEKGVWGRENILVNFENIQQVTIKTSPYQRNNRIADMQVHTAGMTITVPFLHREEAEFIIDFMLAKLEFKEELNAITSSGENASLPN